MAASCSRCGCNLDEHGVCRKCAPGQRGGVHPVVTLALAIVGLFLLPFALAAVIVATRQRRRLERRKQPESKAVRIGLVLGMTGLLLGMIQVCAFIYLLPVILYAPGPSSDEAGAIDALRELHRVQSNYRQLTGRYAPSLDVLVERGFIGSDFKEHKNYRLELVVGEDLDSFEARAAGLKPGLRHFYIDQTGVVRHSKNTVVGPQSPAIRHSESP